MVVLGTVIRVKVVHSQRVVHRDLMPANILLDKRDHPKIGDIRNSRLCDVRQAMTSRFRTMLYPGHEMYDSADHTAAIDVYSFAAIVDAERQLPRPSRKTHPTQTTVCRKRQWKCSGNGICCNPCQERLSRKVKMSHVRSPPVTRVPVPVHMSVITIRLLRWRLKSTSRKRKLGLAQFTRNRPNRRRLFEARA
jgi:serine/threonine protein kinase